MKYKQSIQSLMEEISILSQVEKHTLWSTPLRQEILSHKLLKKLMKIHMLDGWKSIPLSLIKSSLVLHPIRLVTVRKFTFQHLNGWKPYHTRSTVILWRFHSASFRKPSPWPSLRDQISILWKKGTCLAKLLAFQPFPTCSHLYKHGKDSY